MISAQSGNRTLIALDAKLANIFQLSFKFEYLLNVPMRIFFVGWNHTLSSHLQKFRNFVI